MRAKHTSGLEGAVLVASGIVQPVAEVLRQLTGAAVVLDAAEATRAEARDFADGLKGWYWAVPIELTGVHSGAACVLVSQDLVAPQGDTVHNDETAASFASMTDEYLARAAEKLASAWDGPVSLDRLGLRRTSPESAPQVLTETLGLFGLVAVRFPAKGPEGGGEARGEVLVVLGGRLVSELVSEPVSEPVNQPANGQPVPGDIAPTRVAPSESTRRIPAASPPKSPDDLMARVRSLRVRASADVGRKTMTLGELCELHPGSVIDLARKVSEPLELSVQGRLVASGDAVTLPRGFGFRVRYLGVK